MSIAFNPTDNEFAVSTGKNVNNGPGTSEFDHPPNKARDLVITSKEGDQSPYAFEVGDTYRVAYGGAKGATLENAVITRSDLSADGSGFIVFEGTDAGTGATTQVVWTPDSDLRQWYWDNHDRKNPPKFQVNDQQPGSYAYVCFADDTPIQTPRGSVRAGNLVAGDLVLTLEAGVQPVLWTGTRRVTFTATNDTQRPIVIPVDARRTGARGTGRDPAVLRLSPQHRVLVDINGVQTLVPAKGLLCLPGIHTDTACACVTYVTLLCPRHTLISAAGLACETFYPGAQAMKLLSLPEQQALERMFPGVIRDPSVYGPHCRRVTGPGRFARLAATATVRFSEIAPLPARVGLAPLA